MKTFKTLAAIATLSVITMSHEMMERTAPVNPAK